MNDDELDQRLKKALVSYNDPPPPPVEEMWSEIVRRRAAGGPARFRVPRVRSPFLWGAAASIAVAMLSSGLTRVLDGRESGASAIASPEAEGAEYRQAVSDLDGLLEERRRRRADPGTPTLIASREAVDGAIATLERELAQDPGNELILELRDRLQAQRLHLARDAVLDLWDARGL